MDEDTIILAHGVYDNRTFEIEPPLHIQRSQDVYEETGSDDYRHTFTDSAVGFLHDYWNDGPWELLSQEDKDGVLAELDQVVRNLYDRARGKRWRQWLTTEQRLQVLQRIREVPVSVWDTMPVAEWSDDLQTQEQRQKLLG